MHDLHNIITDSLSNQYTNIDTTTKKQPCKMSAMVAIKMTPTHNVDH